MPLVQFDEVAPTIGRITLNDPDNLNAMGEEMAKEFSALVQTIAATPGKYRALILTGAGRAFSAGGNLDMLEKKTLIEKERNRTLMLEFYHSFLSILDLKVPLIAAINGHAVGAGLCLACACDFRIAAEGSKLGVTFLKLGLHPGMGGTHFLPRIVGESLAKELILTGKMIDAPTALEYGLVTRVTPPATLLEAALAIAHEVAACGPLSVKQSLETLRSDPAALKAALEREALCQSQNYASAEFKEGIRATKAKEKPRFV